MWCTSNALLTSGFAHLLPTGFERPTFIQQQAVPLVMWGRDLIGIAETGSGKTGAFLWPLLYHVMDQPPLRAGEGPIAIIVAPTRELAQQIHDEASKYAAKYSVQVGNVFGGVSGRYQIDGLRNKPPEIVVCTPGRLITLMKKRHLRTIRTTMLVLDEADRMLDMGFEPQVRSIVGQLRPDRQTLMFSATFKPKIRRLARDLLVEPVRLNVGDIGLVSENISQRPVLLANKRDKWSWLVRNLPGFRAQGSTLVFVSRKEDCEQLASELSKNGFHVSRLLSGFPSASSHCVRAGGPHSWKQVAGPAPEDLLCL